MKNEEKDFKLFARDHVNSLALHDYTSQFNRSVPTNSMTPYVMEERQMNVAQVDVFSRLMMDRIIFLGHGINDTVANIISAQLLFLNSADPKKEVNLYINSPGGSVYAGLGIYDTMEYIPNDVVTICVGMAASMAAVLLSSGAKGKRLALRHSRVMIHQPMGGAEGQVTDMEITLKEIQRAKEDLYNILSVNTGKTVKVIEKDSDRDYWMRGEEAVKYGLIDKVLTKKDAKK
jgi:ATP-dependent Clp protease protease subunit